MKQKFVWGPAAESIQKSIDINLQAVRTLQQKSRDLQDKLNCLRTQLK
jgi:hypothetical protein